MSTARGPKSTRWPDTEVLVWTIALLVVAIASFLLGRLTAGETPLATGILESVTYETSPGTFATQSGSTPHTIPSRIYSSALVVGDGDQIIPMHRVFAIELRDN